MYTFVLKALTFSNVESAAKSSISQLSHYVRFRFEKPKTHLVRGMIVISIDVDVGNKELGIINGGKNDRNVNNYISEYSVGAVEEMALPLFINLFDQFEVPVTFGIRGQWLEFPNTALEQLLGSSIKHDIGAHGYSHVTFTELSQNEAERELSTISSLMSRLGIVPRSFIFPKNRIAHLNLLEKHGYKCYRDRGTLFYDGMYIRKHNGLYDVHPSLYLDKGVNRILLMKMLDVCISKKLPFHVWFHLWSFGNEQKSIKKVMNKNIFPFLEYARKKADNEELTFETMLSSINRLENLDCTGP